MNSSCWSSGARVSLCKCLSLFTFLCFVTVLNCFFVECLLSPAVSPCAHCLCECFCHAVFGVLFTPYSLCRHPQDQYILPLTSPPSSFPSLAANHLICCRVVLSLTCPFASAAPAAWAAVPVPGGRWWRPLPGWRGRHLSLCGWRGARLGSAGGGRLRPAGGGGPLGAAGGGARFGAAGHVSCCDDVAPASYAVIDFFARPSVPTVASFPSLFFAVVPSCNKF